MKVLSKYMLPWAKHWFISLSEHFEPVLNVHI